MNSNVRPHMLRRRTLLVASVPVFSSAACTWSIEILVSWSNAVPTFQFKDPSALLRIARPVAVNWFAVSPIPEGSTSPDYANPVWSFELRPGDSSKLTEVIYAHCPAGFSERRPATALRPGQQYAATASGPGSIGETRFSVPSSAA
jgi:hypothetical protein